MGERHVLYDLTCRMFFFFLKKQFIDTENRLEVTRGEGGVRGGEGETQCGGKAKIGEGAKRYKLPIIK